MSTLVIEYGLLYFLIVYRPISNEPVICNKMQTSVQRQKKPENNTIMSDNFLWQSKVNLTLTIVQIGPYVHRQD